MNSAGTPGAHGSEGLDLRIEDVADEATFNLILWRAVRPGQPYPGTRRSAALEAVRGR
jgi:hypothetical protein